MNRLQYMLNRISDMIVGFRKGAFGYDVDKQRNYLAKFKEPQNDIERSYYQYKCQMKLNGCLISFIMNLASLPMFIFYLLKKNDSICERETSDVVFFDGKPESILPFSLKNKITNYYSVMDKKEYFSVDDKRLLLKLYLKYPFSFNFLLKCLMKVRFYRYQIECCNPSNIVVCNEYSFTSSFLTMYCNMNGINHINVMHGEKLFYMRDSFFRFNEFWIWNDYYRDLFVSMRAEPNQFVVEIPDSFKLSTDETFSKTVDYTYYLGAEKGDVLKNIVDSMKQLQSMGNIVFIRPHPRYTNYDELINLCGDNYLVEKNDCSLSESVMHSKNAVSLYSTVLNQAFHNNVNIVIDDCSQPEYYRKLKSLGYIMINVEHDILSSVVNGDRK